MKINSFLKEAIGLTPKKARTAADLKSQLHHAQLRAHDAEEHYLNEVYGGAPAHEIADAKHLASQAKREVASLGKQLNAAEKREAKEGQRGFPAQRNVFAESTHVEAPTQLSSAPPQDAAPARRPAPERPARGGHPRTDGPQFRSEARTADEGTTRTRTPGRAAAAPDGTRITQESTVQAHARAVAFYREHAPEKVPAAEFELEVAQRQLAALDGVPRADADAAPRTPAGRRVEGKAGGLKRPDGPPSPPRTVRFTVPKDE